MALFWVVLNNESCQYITLFFFTNLIVDCNIFCTAEILTEQQM